MLSVALSQHHLHKHGWAGRKSQALSELCWDLALPVLGLEQEELWGPCQPDHSTSL